MSRPRPTPGVVLFQEFLDAIEDLSISLQERIDAADNDGDEADAMQYRARLSTVISIQIIAQRMQLVPENVGRDVLARIAADGPRAE